MTGLPLPDFDWPPLKPFWDAAAAHEFRMPRCQECGTFDWYPEGVCRSCRSTDIGWVRLCGRGTLFSWAVVMRPLHPPLAPLGQYVSAIMSIAEDPGTRFVTRLVDAEIGALKADMPVQIRFADAGYPAMKTGRILPLLTVGTTPPAAPDDFAS